MKYKAFFPICTCTTYVNEHHIHTLPIDTHVYQVLSKYIQHAKDGLY